MNREEIDNLLNLDPYFRSLLEYHRSNNLRGDTIKTGRILSKIGNFTGIQNVILECLPIALHSSSSAAMWKLLLYLFRELLGKTRDADGNPRERIRYKVRCIMDKACIDSPASFYIAFKQLEEKRIVYMDEERKYIYLNLFPLTWNVEGERDKRKIGSIMESEIGRIYRKIR